MELVRTVFPSDPDVFHDIQNLRQNDIHKILRRLDALLRQNKSSLYTSLSNDDCKSLLCTMVDSYMMCSDSIKVSRAVEKLWQPLLSTHSHRVYIETCLEDHIMKVTKQKLENLQNVSKFSVLLEQNKTVQMIVKRNLSDIVCWISDELSPLLQLPPSSLSVSQCQCIYALVKIVLQLFQVCSAELGEVIWNHFQPSAKLAENVSGAVKVICNNLLHILCKTGYQTDCVLLSGTATALMLNTSLKPVLAQHVFCDILKSTLDQDATYEFYNILENCGITSMTSIDLDKLTSLTENSVGTVALIRGVVACGSSDFLFDKQVDVTDTCQVHPPMCVTLFSYITSLCHGNITLHYHTFQILLLWYSRILKSSHWSDDTALTNQMSDIIQPTLDIVMLNWDSPVEDVPEAVVDIFDHMMLLWSKVKVKRLDLPESVLETLLSMAWFVKGKYRILAVLLKYLDHRKVLEEHCDVQSQLLQCLTTNHLASTATNVYKAFVTQLQKHPKMDVKSAWQSYWLDIVIQGLTSETSLVRYNTSLHWVPVTLKLVPGSGELLQDELTKMLETRKSSLCYMRVLHAWTVVTKTIRVVTGIVDLSNKYVREALHCLDEEVRSEAISMICTTLKRAEPISSVEVFLLQEALTYNIKIDSAPFRQHLGSDLRKLLTRLRDSCITMLKSVEKNAEALGRSLKFVDWLHRLCIDYLLPGSCYQRRKGSLDILHVIYECLIFKPDDKQRKGFTPETSLHLVDYARESGKWDFFCKENIHVLTLCILDGASEIQTSAFNLLTKYYKFPEVDNKDSPHSLCCHLVRESLRMCNSPKGHESESGSVLCKLVFQKYILAQSVNVDLVYTDDSHKYQVVPKRCEKGTNLEFIHALLDETKRQMGLANDNLVKASKQYPVHGLILAMTRCITESPDLLLIVPCTDAVDLICDLVEFCQEVIHRMLNIMASVAGQEACPSFAEIGVALETLLQENQSDYSESTSQSPEFQYMLSWCWNNINESCSCLGDVTWAVIQNKLPLNYTVIEKISSTFVTVLTKCRHKGVIEGCRSAFVKFCSAVFSSHLEQFYKLPGKILSQVLTSLKNKVMSSSVTRRSAGLPIIVQAVLVSEKKVKQTMLLKRSVLTLFEIAQIPLEIDSGQTDLPQVHGLNILNSLFSDASLSGSLTGHVSQAVVMVIKEFGSPSWAVRNAATRFFSTLITRIFGQKKTADTTLCNTVTFQEFSSYYPELPPFLLSILNEASDRDIYDISQIHPGLFPVLTLLSCLNPADTKSETLLSEIKVFREKTYPFLASPVYQLRHLVASALVSMVNIADMMGYSKRLLQGCMTTQTSNLLHGNLLCILQLVNHISGPEDVQVLLALTLKLQHVLDCVPMVSTEFVKLLYSLVKKQKNVLLPLEFTEKMMERCSGWDETVPTIGLGIFMEQSVNFLFLYNQSRNDDICRMVQNLLSSSHLDARKACLEYLESKVTESSEEFNTCNILKVLCSSLKNEGYVPNLCTILNVITSLYTDMKSLESDCVCTLQDWFSGNSQLIRQYVSLRAAVLPVWGILIQQDLKNDKLENHRTINQWCDSLLENTLVTNETQRLAVTKVLLIAGQDILKETAAKQCENLTDAVVCLLSCCINLIQDEDTDIRQEACRFVAGLKLETHISIYQYESLHSNICYELLLEYTIQQFHFSTRCMKFLIDQLYTQGQLVKVMKEKETTRFLQLFDQEDNSFFAEKIYNAFSIHRCLKTGLKQYPESPIDGCINAFGQVVCEDMDTLKDILNKCDEDSVINPCSDHTVLASMCSILLMCDLINGGEIKEKLFTTLQMGRLPQNVQRQIFNAMAV